MVRGPYAKPVLRQSQFSNSEHEHSSNNSRRTQQQLLGGVLQPTNLKAAAASTLSTSSVATMSARRGATTSTPPGTAGAPRTTSTRTTTSKNHRPAAAGASQSTSGQHHVGQHLAQFPSEQALRISRENVAALDKRMQQQEVELGAGAQDLDSEAAGAAVINNKTGTIGTTTSSSTPLSSTSVSVPQPTFFSLTVAERVLLTDYYSSKLCHCFVFDEKKMHALAKRKRFSCTSKDEDDRIASEEAKIQALLHRCRKLRESMSAAALYSAVVLFRAYAARVCIPADDEEQWVVALLTAILVAMKAEECVIKPEFIKGLGLQLFENYNYDNTSNEDEETETFFKNRGGAAPASRTRTSATAGGPPTTSTATTTEAEQTSPSSMAFVYSGGLLSDLLQRLSDNGDKGEQQGLPPGPAGGAASKNHDGMKILNHQTSENATSIAIARVTEFCWQKAVENELNFLTALNFQITVEKPFAVVALLQEMAEREWIQDIIMNDPPKKAIEQKIKSLRFKLTAKQIISAAILDEALYCPVKLIALGLFISTGHRIPAEAKVALQGKPQDVAMVKRIVSKIQAFAAMSAPGGVVTSNGSSSTAGVAVLKEFPYAGFYPRIAGKKLSVEEKQLDHVMKKTRGKRFLPGSRNKSTAAGWKSVKRGAATGASRAAGDASSATCPTSTDHCLSG
ncbi:unnamed protein product [Amoebophrya sp. A120]|nr:unnamed protein product [Amoebophrya sp. A120]|eukprot:GSA120T00024915001.1